MYRYLLILFCFLAQPVWPAVDPSRDLIALHYDFAPDRDDGHSSAAARSLMGMYGDIELVVVTGAYGTNSHQWVNGSTQLQNAIWGAGHLNAHDNWDRAVRAAAEYWGATIDNGGTVHVAEGGQSDFTADVIRVLLGRPSYSKNRVVVVQHSQWNEGKTSPGVLNFLRANATYVKIPDGNHANATADLNQQSNEFVRWARDGNYSQVWNAAFSYLPVSSKLDFSDTVELLHILGIGKDKISDPATFAQFVASGEVDAPDGNTRITSGGTGVSIVVEAEDYVWMSDPASPSDAVWEQMSQNSGSSGSTMQLLPDTRVTHSDPLINGRNFWNQPGTGPTIRYDVNIPSAGKYLVSVSALSRGSEDNGIHVGINGQWPDSGARMQWCDGKGSWTWSSAQRTASNHCGVANSITIDIPNAGVNTIEFSAREDGFHFDQFRLDALSTNGTLMSDAELALRSSDEFQAVVGARLADIANGVSNNQSLDEQFANSDQLVCTATASSLGAARTKFAQDCAMPVRDCDPANGAWVCSSIQIGRAAPTFTREASEEWLRVNGVKVFRSDKGTDSYEEGNSTVVVDNTDDDAIQGISDDNTNSPVKTAWSDSYSVGGQCFCDSTFDHGIGAAQIATSDGMKTVRQVCADISERYGQGPTQNRTYYNTIQCGNGPANSAADETQCPGIPIAMGNWTGPNCRAKGSTFNIDTLYEVEIEQPAGLVSSGPWWQPKASDELTWYMQFQGEINTSIPADVFFIDADVAQSVIDNLKGRGKKVMCYISAGSSEEWRDDFNSIPKEIIGNDYSGWPGEAWLDVSNIEKIAPIMRARISQCKSKGFDGIDADNVNSHANNTGFSISRSEAIFYIRWLANESHQQGMAFSLKNSEDLALELVDNVDMLQTESCHVYNNCQAASVMVRADKPVFMVEYENITRSWDAACSTAEQLGFSAIFRDVLLTGSGAYRSCGASSQPQ